jgi:hypothetical protein
VCACHKQKQRLLDWCEANFTDPKPVPSVTIAGYWVGLKIGDVEIWDSECGYTDEVDHDKGNGTPTFIGALQCYRVILKKMRPNIETWP